ncbi:hypothetical protein CROQUDRAFT_134915 [Cronartium quercuum f. sp. fusiforme G11]|uniref:Uncharacterized protein n=1 Tax=Cronartium quercuum f. sp. fusiforme G11 TaxID=708437 RepID=A0A9P6NCT5_9BASI|nr:hypothetical protein CROQUDRAFT_134915 [Cronartium quercuum f. sp. fusiforme G11]
MPNPKIAITASSILAIPVTIMSNRQVVTLFQLDTLGSRNKTHDVTKAAYLNLTKDNFPKHANTKRSESGKSVTTSSLKELHWSGYGQFEAKSRTTNPSYYAPPASPIELGGPAANKSSPEAPSGDKFHAGAPDNTTKPDAPGEKMSSVKSPTSVPCDEPDSSPPTTPGGGESIKTPAVESPSETSPATVSPSTTSASENGTHSASTTSRSGDKPDAAPTTESDNQTSPANFLSASADTCLLFMAAAVVGMHSLSA